MHSDSTEADRCRHRIETIGSARPLCPVVVVFASVVLLAPAVCVPLLRAGQPEDVHHSVDHTHGTRSARTARRTSKRSRPETSSAPHGLLQTWRRDGSANCCSRGLCYGSVVLYLSRHCGDGLVLCVSALRDTLLAHLTRSLSVTAHSSGCALSRCSSLLLWLCV